MNRMVQNLSAIPIPNINMADAELEISCFKDIPITAMSHQTRRQLSSSLNNRQYLRSEGGYQRDWRGIAELTDQKNFFDESAISGSDPTSKVLDEWYKCCPSKAHFANLQIILGAIDRWDASDDIYENLVEDAKNYKIKQKELQTRHAMAANKETTNSGMTAESKSDILTVDDSMLLEQNLPPQIYDAFLLYVDCDAAQAADIKRKLEEDSKYNFKICTKDSLLAGNAFVHKAMTRLIDERCNRLIVILTKEFRKSPENDFYMNFAQAESIQKHEVKLIPLVYDNDVEIPRSLRHVSHLRSDSFNFWQRLARSIRPIPLIANINNLSSNSRPQSEVLNLPTPTIDIPSINVTLAQDEKDVPTATSAPIKALRSYKRHAANGNHMNNHLIINKHYSHNNNNKNNKKNSNNDNNKNENFNSKFMQVKDFVLRHAHSTSKLNEKNYKETNVSSSDLSISSQCSETRKTKKKRKFSTKFIKRVFSRSNTKLETAI